MVYFGKLKQFSLKNFTDLYNPLVQVFQLLKQNFYSLYKRVKRNYIGCCRLKFEELEQFTCTSFQNFESNCYFLKPLHCTAVKNRAFLYKSPVKSILILKINTICSRQLNMKLFSHFNPIPDNKSNSMTHIVCHKNTQKK